MNLKSCLYLCIFMDKFQNLVIINDFRMHYFLHNVCSSFAKRIRNCRSKTDIRDCQTILISVSFGRVHINKFASVTGNFSHFSNLFFRYKRMLYKVTLVKVANPFGISLICLFAFNGFNIFWVSKTNVQFSFKDVINWNLVFTCRFHTDIMTIM